MYWIGICDDEKEYREEIKSSLNRYCEERKLLFDNIFEYESGEEINNYSELDILFLDVQMKEIDGICVKDRFEAERIRTKIIFISSCPESMPEAFGTNVIGFLTKPINYEIFCEKVDKAIKKASEDARYIFFNEAGNSKKVYISDILYVRADGRYKEIHMIDKSKVLLSEKSLKYYQEELGKDAWMSHKSYLINLSHVVEVDNEVILDNGEKLPISRRYRSAFVERFRKNIWNRT